MFAAIKDRARHELRTHHKLVKSMGYLIFLRGLQILLGLAATYFITHAISKSSFGEYQFVLSAVGILTIFSLKGLNDSVLQAISRGYLGNYRRAAQVSFFSSFLASFVLAGMGIWHYYRGDGEIAYGFAIAAFLFPFLHGLTQWRSLVMGTENFLGYFLHNGLSYLVMYPLMITAVVLVPGSFLLPLLFVFLIPSIQNVFLTIRDYRKIPADAPAEEGNMAYGVKVTAYMALGTLTTHIDKLLLFYCLSPVALATYVAADRIADLFRSFVQDSSVVLAPRFARFEHYTANLDRYIRLGVTVYGVSIVLFSFTLLPFFIIFLFGENYSDSIPYAQALMCSVAVGNAAILKFRFIRSRIDIASYHSVMVITSAARIVMSVILIPWLGIAGAVISVFAYRLFFALVVNAVIKKRYPVGGAA